MGSIINTDAPPCSCSPTSTSSAAVQSSLLEHAQYEAETARCLPRILTVAEFLLALIGKVRLDPLVRRKTRAVAHFSLV